MHWGPECDCLLVPDAGRHKPQLSHTFFTTLSVLLALFAATTSAQECEDWRARLIKSEGTVEVRRAGQALWSPATDGDEFFFGDSIQTDDFSRATILLFDGTKERLNQNTTITFTETEDCSESLIDLVIGALHTISRQTRGLRILTPFANAGVEGTEFLVSVSDDQTEVLVVEGTVVVSNPSGQVSVSDGQGASARAGQAPMILQATVKPLDAVQWALYYEPVIDGRNLSPGDAPPANRAADPVFYAARAAQRLAVGQVEAAEADIAESLRLDSTSVEARALQSIIALTRRDKDLALRLANEAVSMAPESAAALLALSYAQQAHFDVDSAVATLRRAADSASDSALVWSRLSELELAVGNLDAGLRAAETAVAMDPGVARTQTVLGFAYLTQVKLGEARRAFVTAIDLDPAAPLPRLGLGLTLIREGELEAGREEIEVAVMLDPGNSLIRSYMGKTYYEERRNALAQSQYTIAKNLDPRDPTPELYDAIRKQTENDPAAALEDLQRAIELNDNRGVYRSKLSLDEDLAVRSASLARIYGDLGFERAALVEGWNSVATDPADYSGHRLLADLYGQEPRHQIARVNELFRSQLLQPLSLTPIPAQLAELNPFILDSAGPAELAFNEYNPVFSRNRLAFQGSVVGGGNDMQGGDLVMSGIHDNISYSISGFHFETDGYRENNDFAQDVYSAFVQFRPTYKTSIQAELRTSETEKGDLTLLFDPLDYNPILRQFEDADSMRIGARHSFNPRSDLLTSITFQQLEATSQSLPSFSAFTKLEGHTVDLQHIYRADAWHLTTGIGQVDDDLDDTLDLSIPVPFPPFLIQSSERTLKDVEHTNGYLYANLNLSAMTLTLGVTHDSLEGITRSKDQTNPKFGITWKPMAGATFRAAAFRTLQGPVVSRQHITPRLEPTQVAGFNQFFFGEESEDVRRYGLGFDFAHSGTLFSGAEISRRDIDYPFIDASTVPPTPNFVDVSEDLARVYVNWAINSSLAASAEYQQEERDNQGLPLGGTALRLETERLPVEIRYFHRSGLSASARATFVDQRGSFLDMAGPPPFPIVDDQDRFYVVDASVSYRLPKRRGMVSLAINNLLDETFRFQDTDSENPRILPGRTLFLRFTGAY